MNKTRRIAAFLAAILMLAPLVSCSDNAASETDAPAQTEATVPGETTPSSEIPGDEIAGDTEAGRVLPDIPATADFGGETYNFLVWSLPEWEASARGYRDIYAEALNGEVINDAVFNRNLRIQENYNVIIAQEKMHLNDIDGALSQSIAAADNSYTVVYPRLLEASGMFQKAYFHNLFNVPNLDFEKPWWDHNCISSLSVHNILLAAASSININDKDATAALAFNKGIAANNSLEDVYTLVREGAWTYDKFSELADMCDQDIDGDGKITPEDVYGIVGCADVLDAFWHGAGLEMVSKNDDGEFIFTYGSERDLDASLKIIDLMQQAWFYNGHKFPNANDTVNRQLFETGHGLFYWIRLDMVTNMRNGEAEFGVIPTPKYEESQEKYFSMVSQHTAGIMSIPLTVVGDTLDHVGMVLEAMAADSHYSLMPEYIELSLKTKYSRDAESADMLDIILSNRVFDPMNIYNFGGFSARFGAFGTDNVTNLSSMLKRNTKIVNRALEKFNEDILKNNENQMTPAE